MGNETEEKKDPPAAPPPPGDPARIKALEDLVADLSKKLNEATAAKGKGDVIPVASESSVHALKEELAAVRAELKEALSKAQRPRSFRWVPG